MVQLIVVGENTTKTKLNKQADTSSVTETSAALSSFSRLSQKHVKYISSNSKVSKFRNVIERKVAIRKN